MAITISGDSPNFTTATTTTATVTTLNTPTGVLATQNGMTGIAKAWVNFTGSSATINGSFNISSITRTSAGSYTVSFTTAMPNINYSAVGNCSSDTGTQWTFLSMFTNSGGTPVAPTTSSFILTCIKYNAGTTPDPAYVNISVFSS